MRFECGLDQAGFAQTRSAVDEQHLGLAVATLSIEHQGDQLLFGSAAIQALATGRNRVGAAGLEGGDGFACGPLPLAMGQVYGQSPGALVAGVRLLCQGLGQDPAQWQRYLAVDLTSRAWLNAGVQLAPVLGIPPGQRQLAQQQLVENRTQGVDVAAPVAAAAVGADLLRRQVGPVAERVALFADQLWCVGTKTAQPHPLVRLQANMFGLQRTVQHIALVGLSQGVGGIYRDIEEQGQVNRAFTDQVGDGAAGRVHQQRAFGAADER